MRNLFSYIVIFTFFISRVGLISGQSNCTKTNARGGFIMANIIDSNVSITASHPGFIRINIDSTGNEWLSFVNGVFLFDSNSFDYNITARIDEKRGIFMFESTYLRDSIRVMSKNSGVFLFSSGIYTNEEYSMMNNVQKRAFPRYTIYLTVVDTSSRYRLLNSGLISRKSKIIYYKYNVFYPSDSSSIYVIKCAKRKIQQAIMIEDVQSGNYFLTTRKREFLYMVLACRNNYYYPELNCADNLISELRKSKYTNKFKVTIQ